MSAEPRLGGGIDLGGLADLLVAGHFVPVDDEDVAIGVELREPEDLCGLANDVGDGGAGLGGDDDLALLAADADGNGHDGSSYDEWVLELKTSYDKDNYIPSYTLCQYFLQKLLKYVK